MKSVKKREFSRNYEAWRADAMALLCIAAACFISIALLFHNPSDHSWRYHTNSDTPITNRAGAAGAQVAGVLFYFFGASSLFILFVLGLCAYTIIMRRSWTQEWDRMSAACILTGVCAALLNAYQIDFLASAFPGGLFGFFAYHHLENWFDRVGALLALYALLTICLLILTRASLVSVLRYGSVLVRAFFSRRVMIFVVRGIGSSMRIMVKPFMYVGIWYRSLFDGSLTTDVEQLLSVTRYGIPHDEHATLFDMQQWSTDQSRTNNVLAVDVPAQSAQEQTVQNSTHHNAVLDVVEEQNRPQEKKAETQSQKEAVAHAQSKSRPSYILPSMRLLHEGKADQHDAHRQREFEAMARLLEEKLVCFGVHGAVVAIKQGPVVILFEYQPEMDTKISKITALEDDLALALQAMSIRIIAPIPGRSVVGFEVASRQRQLVYLGDIVRSAAYQQRTAALPLVLGKDTVGNHVVVDLTRMPHLLVAGSTGSGKSVGLHVMVMSLLLALRPDQLKIILIDPKRLEFTAYAESGHLLFPIVTDPKQAIPTLAWVVSEMERRYERMAACGARTMLDYNNRVANEEYLPYIVVIIDELSDLMMTVGKAAEDLIVRITQMARAAGIHMIVATQRPSVDVITGLIKVNFPSRIAFKVTAKVDSRTILDVVGADKLLGRGDMLFLDAAESVLKRVHGAYVTDAEIHAVVSHVKTQGAPSYQKLMPETVTDDDLLPNDQELFQEIVVFLQKVDEISISLLQRKFRVGYNRSARIMDMLEARGLIMPSDGGKMRRVIK